MGVVESVAPDDIRVLLDTEAPQAVALNAGQPQRFPRINGFVLIPNEAGALVGVVSWLGVERSPYPKRTGLKDFGLVDLPFPLRKMSLVPLGTLTVNATNEGTEYELHRGVASFPSIGDPVHLPSTGQLRALVEARGANRRVPIGTSPLAADAPVSVDPDKLFGRHLAILGNTGSGKSCSLAGLIRWSLDAAERKRGGAPHARFILLDPNGEYRTSFGDIGDVRTFAVRPGEGSEAAPLRVPAWMWNSHEWAAFAQAAPKTQRPLLMQGLRNLRAGRTLEAGKDVALAGLVRGYLGMLEAKIAAGPPAYAGKYGVRKECGDLVANFAAQVARYREQLPELRDELDALIGHAEQAATSRRWDFKNGTGYGYDDFTEEALEEVRACGRTLLDRLPSGAAIGGISEDAPLPFDSHELAGQLEALSSTEDFSQTASFIPTLLLRIRSMLADARLSPIVAPDEEITFEEWLTDYVGAAEAENGPIAVLDLSMVPADILQVVIAVVGRVVFEALQRHRKLCGDELPTVLALEEAHSFVQRHLGDEPEHATPARMCRETFERIAREGRKFGLGLLLSSQRPSELSPTVLAQCNTFLLHRLVNDRDQDLVRRLVPGACQAE